jgi:hypothetical protein
MKYDDASWHYGADNFPQGLDNAAGATHIALFVAWCMLNGLAGALHREDFPDQLGQLTEHALTPGQWFMQACDGKFTDEDVNDEGNAFAAVYYAADGAQYLADYDNILCNAVGDPYEVPDSWQSYDLLAPTIAQRYREWKRSATDGVNAL